jgi:glutamate dehydrogenase (NAD(P)+)
MNLAGIRVAVQGFGNVGGASAEILAEMGCRIVAVSDIDGAVSNPAGLDLERLHRHVAETGSVKGFAGGVTMPSGQLLEADCDVLVPAASGGQITAENAGRIRAKIIAEGANGPTTCEADVILATRGITVLPDILCNAGGVFVSYLEYTQETQKEQMTEERVNQRLAERMVGTYRQVVETAKTRGLSLRRAAMLLAVQRVCEAVEARGNLP